MTKKGVQGTRRLLGAFDREQVELAFESALDASGIPWRDDPEMARTPARMAHALHETTVGYEKLGPLTTFPTNFTGMLVRPGIEFHSTCAHHGLPVIGKAWIAYLPKGVKLGISKFPRLIQHYSKRFTSQEELTEFLADEIQKVTKPKGVYVVLSAHHACEICRGVEASPTPTTTSSVRGNFWKPEVRQEAQFLWTLRPA